MKFNWKEEHGTMNNYKINNTNSIFICKVRCDISTYLQQGHAPYFI